MKKNKKTARYWIGKMHLWLGFTSGLVVFIVALTGCIYAFQAEIQDATQPYRFVQQQNKPALLPSEIKSIASGTLPGKHPHSVLYSAGRSAQVVFYNADPQYYYIVYVDPYSGEVLKVKNMNRDFFGIILNGHFYLWLPAPVGQPVVAISILVFVVMVITGLILWWPRNRKSARQRFIIKWNARWRRKNYDLHNILGFYISLLVLVLALTGLVWGFDWFAGAVYKTASGGKTMVPYYEPQSDTSAKALAQNRPAIDAVWLKMMAIRPDAKEIEVHYPETAEATVAANANPQQGTYWKRDHRYFDQYTLKEVEVTHLYGRFDKAQFAEKLMRMNYDIHVGAIGGIAGKFLAFCVSLVAASLPVTGFMIWLGRRKKAHLVKHPMQAVTA